MDKSKTYMASHGNFYEKKSADLDDDQRKMMIIKHVI